MVARSVGAAQVIEQPPALAYHFQQPSSGTMVFDVGLEVLGQFVDARGEQRNLHVGRPSVLRMELKLFRDFGFFINGNHGVFNLLSWNDAVSLSCNIWSVKEFFETSLQFLEPLLNRHRRGLQPAQCHFLCSPSVFVLQYTWLVFRRP